MRITSGGQISVPATIRRRWGVAELVLTDLGDRVVLRPAADDPISAAAGALAGRLPSTDELRRQAREDDAGAEARRSGRT